MKKNNKYYRLFCSLLMSGQNVIYKGKEYHTGNRYHDMVELYQDRKFIINVDMNRIKLTKDSKDSFVKRIKRDIRDKENEIMELKLLTRHI